MDAQVRAFAERLRERRMALGIRKQELATRVGGSLTTLQQYENGQFPKGEYAIQLARVLECSLDWLLVGRGEAENFEETYQHSQIFVVPLVEARFSGAVGFEKSDELAAYAFHWDFLHRWGEPSRMVLLRVSGDSMQPRIQHNDVVLLDQSQCEPIPGHIYAVGVEEMVYLKVANAVPGKLVFTSDNPAYAPIEQVHGEGEGRVCIIGKAICVLRELL